jgi:hypothetical protein
VALRVDNSRHRQRNLFEESEPPVVLTAAKLVELTKWPCWPLTWAVSTVLEVAVSVTGGRLTVLVRRSPGRRGGNLRGEP